jgi:hypothetical protein
VSSQVIGSIVERLARHVGLPIEHSESLHVVHYERGQHYGRHVDSFASLQQMRPQQRSKFEQILKNGELLPPLLG